MDLKKITIGLITIAATTALIAGPRGMMGGGMMKYSVCSPYNGIELSSSQQDELSQLRSELRTSVQSLKTTYTNPTIAATENGTFDTNAFAGAANTISNASVTLRADYKKLMYNVLTADQQKVYVENITKISEGDTCNLGRRF